MDEWTGEEITVEPVATSTGQSLEWNCNDGLLYWTQYDSESEDWFNTAKLFKSIRKQPRARSSRRISLMIRLWPSLFGIWTGTKTLAGAR